jgi:hypothetical protein
MHNCEEFRERITEHIIDRDDVAVNPEFHRKLLMCSSCSEFYVQSREMIEALDGIDLMISERQWQGIEQRLRAQLFNLSEFQDAEKTPPKVPVNLNGFRRFSSALKLVPFSIGAVALLLVTVGLSRLAAPLTKLQMPVAPSQAIYIEHSVPLDPVTVDFLEESELLLRNVMKIAPADVEDLAQAKKVASQQLAGLEQRKEAAAEVPPVLDVMKTYETVLRDLRNVDERTVGEDISDLQQRIQKNGLIANMKTFQPRATEISFGLR